MKNHYFILMAFQTHMTFQNYIFEIIEWSFQCNYWCFQVSKRMQKPLEIHLKVAYMAALLKSDSSSGQQTET